MGPREIIAQRIVASGALPPGATIVLSDPPPCGLGDRWREIIDGAERAHADGDGIPLVLNRWLTLTTESLAANEGARRQIRDQQQGKFTMAKTIGTREAALRAQRATDAPTISTPAQAGPTAGAPSGASTAPSTTKSPKASAQAKPETAEAVQMKESAVSTKTKKAATKAKAQKASKAKARAPVKAKTATSGVRPGSKLKIIVDLLTRKEGCTTAEVLKATGWKQVSIPPTARRARLKLTTTKEDGVTRYRADVA